jgi:prepilin-type N-terminal cleavage/methylation domain-containing protein
MNRRGFAFIELVVVVAIVGIAMLIAAQLTRTVLRTTSKAQQAISQVAATDRIADRIRADVWNAIELISPNGRTLVLRSVGSKSVIWQIARDGKQIRRAHWAGEALITQNTWPCPAGLSFKAGMHTATLIQSGDATQPGGQMKFASQVLTGSGGQR